MVRTAEETARSAELVTTNRVGFCLQWCRERADIDARWPTAAVAAVQAERMHHNHDVPRGAFAYWLGGSDGSGHIAIGVGDGMVRSTDAGAPGRVATKPVGFFEDNWHLTYVGWADNVNGVTVPGVGDWFDMATEAQLRAIVRDEIANAPQPPSPPSPGDIAKAVGALLVRNEGTGKKAVSLRAAIRETFEKVTGR